MKSSTILLTITLLALLSTVLSAPLPSSSVVLKLSDGRTSKCDLPYQPSREKVDLVSSKLVASSKIACPASHEHPSGGKTVQCEQSQLAATDEANDMLHGACDDHQGVHSVA
ncbi:hypothetical protein EX895_002753 [Sporisorium graminicola]|uniref:Uncharacterized protein n=1 Tax=Sporisorium graminicola TaxID=280036 RepID=A0A4U7KUZ1_9BASI|nr:hypothetical protein EX895_002753 [Sporisorium graminicola]TKY88401.1 hypothetical protein EX895_002753 [Sporisorium graminicola]